MDKYKKNTYIAAVLGLFLIVFALYFLFVRQKSENKIESNQETNIVKDVSEVDVSKRPYVTLTPTSDGAEIIVSIEKMSDFDKIEYELTYLADNPQLSGEKIERGATGSDVNTKDEKYKKSILLGTGSKGVRSPDTGITDGKLTLHLIKGQIEYQSETKWDMFKIGTTSSDLKFRDDKLQLSIPSINKPYWLILADTVGIPPNNESLDAQSVILPVYGVFSVAPPLQKGATVKIKIDYESKDLKLRTYLHQEGTWDETVSPSFDQSSKTLSTKVKTLSTYVVSSK